MRLVLGILTLIWLLPAQASVREHSEAYFQVYAERQDFPALLAFYGEEAVLEDMVYGHLAEGRDAIAELLDWSRGEFRVADGGPALVVEQLVVEGQTAVARGHFRAFLYEGEVLGPWRFTIWLEWDEQGRIRHQTDWINYTPRQRYLGGDNRNRAVEE